MTAGGPRRATITRRRARRGVRDDGKVVLEAKQVRKVGVNLQQEITKGLVPVNHGISGGLKYRRVRDVQSIAESEPLRGGVEAREVLLRENKCRQIILCSCLRNESAAHQSEGAAAMQADGWEGRGGGAEDRRQSTESGA